MCQVTCELNGCSSANSIAPITFVEELNHCQQVVRFDALHVDEGVWMLIPFQLKLKKKGLVEAKTTL